jgi:hypothetical protein
MHSCLYTAAQRTPSLARISRSARFRLCHEQAEEIRTRLSETHAWIGPVQVRRRPNRLRRCPVSPNLARQHAAEVASYVWWKGGRTRARLMHPRRRP